MLNWLKRIKSQPRDQSVADEQSGSYKGDGIWSICPDCDQPHEVTDQKFLAQVEDACIAVSRSTQDFYEKFHINETDGRWDIAPEDARFTKTVADGRRAHGTYGLVGSWNEKTHSWLWAWEMEESWMPRAAIQASLALKARGEQNNWDATKAKHLLVNEHEAWHLTNLAAHAAGFPGTYRAKVNDLNHHYFIIDDLEWEHVH